jgi:hypothetical protein
MPKRLTTEQRVLLGELLGRAGGDEMRPRLQSSGLIAALIEALEVGQDVVETGVIDEDITGEAMPSDSLTLGGRTFHNLESLKAFYMSAFGNQITDDIGMVIESGQIDVAYQVPVGKKLRLIGGQFGTNFLLGYCDEAPTQGGATASLVNPVPFNPTADGNYSILPSDPSGTSWLELEIPAGKYPFVKAPNGGNGGTGLLYGVLVDV